MAYKYDDQLEIAERKLAERHPDLSKIDRDTALLMTRAEKIELDEWVARASRWLSDLIAS